LATGVAITPSGLEFPPTSFIDGYTKDEDIALAGQKGFAPSDSILASNVFIGGISLPYVESDAGSTSGASVTGNAASMYPVVASPAPFPYPVATFSGVTGQIRQPIIGDPLPGMINGQPRLTSAEVAAVIAAAADRVRTTRAGIRLPIGSRMEVFITVVNNPNALLVGPTVLGAFRTGEATIFSWDVAVQKGRTAVGFSNNTRAFSTRTVGFLAQSHFPPGIDPDGPGPFYLMQEALSGFDPALLPKLIPNLRPPAALAPPYVPPSSQFPNGITIFPGGFPLYRNGVLIGAVGISGDGVDQDDIVGASGSSVFLPPIQIEADRFEFDDTRLPYAKFPRDPDGISDPPTPVILPIFAPTPPTAELANISVRLRVDVGERLMIGGFIITGDTSKRVVVRGLGPSLAAAGIASPLADPALQLHDSLGNSFAQNLNWKDTQQSELLATGLAPQNDLEAATMQTLAPAAYTATMTGENGGTGVGLLEVYEADQSLGNRVANLSGRGFVGTGDEVMIGGFIVRGNGMSADLLVRALGPSLSANGITQPLADPRIEIRDSNGALIAANNDWRDTQASEIQSRSLAPPNELEAAAIISAGPGAYTAILQGNGGVTGVALLEIYRLQ
ncbi:MAG: heme-binding protein, partial [Chthoniobacterales bacterium]